MNNTNNLKMNVNEIEGSEYDDMYLQVEYAVNEAMDIMNELRALEEYRKK